MDNLTKVIELFNKGQNKKEAMIVIDDFLTIGDKGSKIIEEISLTQLIFDDYGFAKSIWGDGLQDCDMCQCSCLNDCPTIASNHIRILATLPPSDRLQYIVNSVEGLKDE